MSPGKLAAQASHAAVEAYKLSRPELVEQWELAGHYTKLVCAAHDELQLEAYRMYIEGRGYRTAPIIDEGRTEIRPFSFTALGVEVVDKDDTKTNLIFDCFELYKPLHWSELAEEIKGRQQSRWKRLKAAW